MNPESRSKPAPRSVLLVEDDEDFAFAIQNILVHQKFEVLHETTLNAARQVFAVKRFDAVLLDLSLPDGDASFLISELAALQPECPIVVLTGRDDAETAVRALRSGAGDYLTKPVRREHLLSTLRSAFERSVVRRELEAFQHGAASSETPIGDSAPWQRTLEILRAASLAPKTTVLVTGEPGVGKELASSLIHRWSRRSSGPYIAVNAACLSPNLIESELFGHEAGAFTGAQKLKRGLFELASGGTLFLDEIGELPLELQAKLLRVLEGHPFRRLGGEREIVPDVRLICATNRSLEEAVRENRFRQDLYSRLRVLEVVVPPLRERLADVRKLALHFVAKLGAEMGLSDATISREALERMSVYAWPGNVRELRNVLERALVLARGEIGERHLPPELRLHSSWPPAAAALPEPLLNSSLAESERRHVLAIYQHTGQNLTQTAKQLGISRVSLRKRLQAYGAKPAPS